jgi:hypothetical protein
VQNIVDGRPSRDAEDFDRFAELHYATEDEFTAQMAAHSQGPNPVCRTTPRNSWLRGGVKPDAASPAEAVRGSRETSHKTLRRRPDLYNAAVVTLSRTCCVAALTA